MPKVYTFVEWIAAHTELQQRLDECECAVCLRPDFDYDDPNGTDDRDQEPQSCETMNELKSEYRGIVFEQMDKYQRAMRALRGAVAVAAMLWIGCGSSAVTRVDVREREDSVVVRGDTVRIVDVRSDTVYVNKIDTTIISYNPSAKPDTIRIRAYRHVLADLDTTIEGITLFAEFEYPPDRWRLDVLQRDTVIRWKVRDSIIQRPYAVEYVPFWVYAAFIGMALAIVALLRRR